MQEYNELNFVWIAVKWLFGVITNLFKFLYFKRNVKIGLSSVGKMYVVPALLCNAITCQIYDITKISLYVKPSLGCDRFAWFVDVLGKILRCSCLFFSLFDRNASMVYCLPLYKLFRHENQKGLTTGEQRTAFQMACKNSTNEHTS